MELAAQTVGIVGVGRIGQRVAQRLQPFGCRLVGFDIDPALRPRFAELGVEWMESLDALLSLADIVTLHVPKTPQTAGMIGRAQLARMKRGARLVNTSRGGILDEAELLRAIDSGHLAGAALDVLAQEPPFDLPPEQVRYANALLNHPRILVTPHAAASVEEAQRRIALDLAQRMLRALGSASAPTQTAGLGGRSLR